MLMAPCIVIFERWLTAGKRTNYLHTSAGKSRQLLHALLIQLSAFDVHGIAYQLLPEAKSLPGLLQSQQTSQCLLVAAVMLQIAEALAKSQRCAMAHTAVSRLHAATV